MFEIFLSPWLEPTKHYGSKSKKKHHHVPAPRDVSDAITAEKSDKKSQQDCKSNDAFQENNENKNSNNYIDNAIAKSNDSGSDGSQIQCIRFSVFQQHQWHTLLDHNHQEL